jgi:hypothetical protein
MAKKQQQRGRSSIAVDSNSHGLPWSASSATARVPSPSTPQALGLSLIATCDGLPWSPLCWASGTEKEPLPL